MMRVNWTWVGLLVLSLLLPLSEAADEPKEKTMLRAKVKEGSTTRPLRIEEVVTQQRAEKPEGERIRMPIYKPPQRGAPGGRVGGGTRGGPG